MTAALAKHMDRHRLLPETQRQYQRIAARVDGEHPVAWLNRKINARTPVGTVLPLLACKVKVQLHRSKHLNRFSIEEGGSVLPLAHGLSRRVC